MSEFSVHSLHLIVVTNFPVERNLSYMLCPVYDLVRARTILVRIASWKLGAPSVMSVFRILLCNLLPFSGMAVECLPCISCRLLLVLSRSEFDRPSKRRDTSCCHVLSGIVRRLSMC